MRELMVVEEFGWDFFYPTRPESRALWPGFQGQLPEAPFSSRQPLSVRNASVQNDSFRWEQCV